MGFAAKAARSLGQSTAWLLLALFGLAPASAGPLEELHAIAQLPAIDLGRLKNGEIITQRGSAGNFSRGISLESCYFIHAPMATVGQALLHWNPRPHPEMEVRLYRDFRWPGGPEVFQTARLDGRNAQDRWLIDRTLDVAAGGTAGDLHLTNAEVDLVRQIVPKKEAAPAPDREARANAAWQEILRRRTESLARGGIAAVAPYGADGSISPGSEFRGLLSLAPRVAKHFQPLINARPLRADAGTAADEAVGYWEATLVRSHTTFQLGVFAARKSAESWQLLDCVYYPSDTYFMALDLFQLWPVEGGTLVWQAGFVSAPFRTYLGGVDRLFAGRQMNEETLDTIKAFRGDVEKR